MNIAKFNEELRNKIIKAQRLEKQLYFKAAKDVWLEISEFTLNASKDPKIDQTFRNMLIQKTEKIIAHIKNLQESKIEKSRAGLISSQKTHEVDSEKAYVKGQDPKIQSEGDEKEVSSEEINLDELPDVPKDSKVKNVSEFKNLPSGFKEIETSEDYKIITPFDVKFVNDRLKSADDYDQKTKSLSKKKGEGDTQVRLDEKTEDGNIICFACGHGNPPGTKHCKNCGTPLK